MTLENITEAGILQNLEANKDVLGEQLYSICLEVTKSWGQGHLFENWPPPEKDDAKKLMLAEQLAALDRSYPGGMKNYIGNLTRFDSKQNDISLHEYELGTATGSNLKVGTAEFFESEEVGMSEIAYSVFVVIAEDLGSNFGFKGASIAVPCEVLTGKSFLQLYCESILALQARAREIVKDEFLVIPLILITTNETHFDILSLLQSNSNFGMAEEQVTIIKQEHVPVTVGPNCQLYTEKGAPYKIVTTSRGNGDIHSLIFRLDLANKWLKDKKKWLCMINDLNSLVFRGIPAALGVSLIGGRDVNIIGLSRSCNEDNENVIVKLVENSTSKSMTLALPSKKLEKMFTEQDNPAEAELHSDISIHPRATSTMIIKLDSYSHLLQDTEGIMPEGLRITELPPHKRSNEGDMSQGKSLSCSIEDFTRITSKKELKGGSNPYVVGYTVMERFLCFSRVKNSTLEGLKSLRKTGFAETASSSESELYDSNRRILALCGCRIKTADLLSKSFAGIPMPLGAKVVLCPRFGSTIREVRDRFPSPSDVFISETSSIVLDGDIVIQKLHLDGDLRVRAAPGAKVVIKSLKIVNDGVIFSPLSKENQSKEEGIIEEKYSMRGYIKTNEESLVVDAPSPGVVVVDRPF